MNRRIIILCLVILTILGAILATDALLNYLEQPKTTSLGATMEANFPRPNYFQLFVTNEMGEYIQPLVTPSGRVYITQIKRGDDGWIYTLPNGAKSIMSFNSPMTIFWAVDRNGDLVEATVWVDEYGVWIDMRLFDNSKDI